MLVNFLRFARQATKTQFQSNYAVYHKQLRSMWADMESAPAKLCGISKRQSRIVKQIYKPKLSAKKSVERLKTQGIIIRNVENYV